MVGILSRQRDAILGAVRQMYTDVASSPAGSFHFPVGRSACELVGYPAEELAALPEQAVESFAGVGYPFAAGGIAPGETVLDVGAGSGTDALLASARVGAAGRVLALDLTGAMLRKLRRSLDAAGVANVTPVCGEAEAIPLADASVDVVTSNGVLNLVPDKARALSEIHRVLRPGGGLQLADIALGEPVSPDCASDPALWAECVVGAVLESAYLEMLASCGFVNVRVLGRFDYFSASPSVETRSVAESFGARAMVLYASKPPARSGRWAPSPWPPPIGDRPAAPTLGDAPHADDLLEACGSGCGTLEPLLRDRMRGLKSGQVLEVRADEPEVRLGLPAWCRLTGHSLFHVTSSASGISRYFLRKK